MCLPFFPPPTVFSTTSAPYTTAYKVADVPQQPSSLKINAYQRSMNSSTIQTDAGVVKMMPEVHPSLSKTTLQSQILEKSRNQVSWKEDSNKSISASLPARSQAGSPEKTQRIRSSPSQTNSASLKNISEVTAGQVQSKPQNTSNANGKTVDQASERGVPTLGKSLTE